MNLPSSALSVPLNDLLYKPTIILRKYDFTGFYLFHNTASKYYCFGAANNVGIKLVCEFNLLRIGKHDLADLQQEFNDSYQSFKVIAIEINGKNQSISDSGLAKDIESSFITKFQLKKRYNK